VVVTGPAGDRMGKQHNLAAAASGAKHPTIASMDADVRVDPDALATGLRALAARDAGVVYLLPRYRGPGRAGGALVAISSNLYYQLYMGAFALTRNAPFITGGLWLMSRRNDHGENDPYPAAMIFHCWLLLFVSLHWPRSAPLAVRPMPSRYRPVARFLMRTLLASVSTVHC